MKYFSYIGMLTALAGSVLLATYAPDTLSLFISAAMVLIIFAGIVMGLLPAVFISSGLKAGTYSIRRAAAMQTDSSWNALIGSEDIFKQKTLNGLFLNYQEKVQSQRESGQLMSDIEDFINEEVIAIRTWQNVMTQIPEILTGLGILGTFIGLIIGIRGVGFSSVTAALTSVQALLAGIETAFYTSVVGVILSIVFNMVYRTTWNFMLRDLAIFTEEFHLRIIPSVEEQKIYAESRDIKTMISLLERLPKNPGYSVSGVGGMTQSPQAIQRNEQILMPQILEGLKNKEFDFYIQPVYNLATRQISSAEALVRWHHPKLGVVSPSVFIPVLEQNGSITRLDHYTWESTFAKIREWIDKGLRPVPISVNITKTDILAVDVPAFFVEMLKKYKIPPMNLQVEIAKNAYTEAPGPTVATEAGLKQLGFKVILDGLDGNFVEINVQDGMNPDCVKLDLRHFSNEQIRSNVPGIINDAVNRHIEISAAGIENMEHMAILRKSGCINGQGYFLSKPISADDYETSFLQ